MHFLIVAGEIARRGGGMATERRVNQGLTERVHKAERGGEVWLVKGSQEVNVEE